MQVCVIDFALCCLLSSYLLFPPHQSRLIKLNDLPLIAGYFFVEPDYTTDEAQSMLKNTSPDVYGQSQAQFIHPH